MRKRETVRERDFSLLSRCCRIIRCGHGVIRERGRKSQHTGDASRQKKNKARRGNARQGKTRQGTRHKVRGMKRRNLTPCLGLTNARMRPGANAHTTAAAAAAASRTLASFASSLFLPLSPPLSLSLSLSLSVCVMILLKFKILNCNRSFNVSASCLE